MNWCISAKEVHKMKEVQYTYIRYVNCICIVQCQVIELIYNLITYCTRSVPIVQYSTQKINLASFWTLETCSPLLLIVQFSEPWQKVLFRLFAPTSQKSYQTTSKPPPSLTFLTRQKWEGPPMQCSQTHEKKETSLTWHDGVGRSSGRGGKKRQWPNWGHMKVPPLPFTLFWETLFLFGRKWKAIVAQVCYVWTGPRCIQSLGVWDPDRG